MSTTKKPSEIIDLKNWYLTLPIGKPGSPTCIYNPDLKNYENDKHFYTNRDDNGDAIVFTAHCGGVTTKNTKYPRSELREMFETNKASWSTTKGVHTMTTVACVKKLPTAKPHVVVGQIHNGADDVIEVRLTGKKLEVIHDEKHYGALDEDYKLAEKFTLKIRTIGGVIEVYYNDMDTPKLKIPGKTDKCYFKMGCYTQSNTTKGDKPDAYAEVWVYALDVKHE